MWWLRLVVVVVTVSFTGRDAAADDRPWAVGVTEDEQATALAIYEAGNAEFLEARFTLAIAKYREAMIHWDHPAIRFNLAVSLINLGQLLEARDHLEASLAYGAVPLGEDVFTQALTYRKLLDGQLAYISIECADEGADVSIDGQRVRLSAGRAERWLTAGRHQLVAEKPGFVATIERLQLEPGTRERHVLMLSSTPRSTPMRRRWPTWKPWAIAGAGVLAASVGGIVLAMSSRDFDAYDRAVATECPRGCTATELSTLDAARTLDTRARGEQIVAVTLLSIGGAALVTGVIGIVLNQPRPRLGHLAVIPTRGGAVLGFGAAF